MSILLLLSPNTLTRSEERRVGKECGDGKDIDVLLDVVFVICVIYGSMRDMVVKDSENMRL